MLQPVVGWPRDRRNTSIVAVPESGPVGRVCGTLRCCRPEGERTSQLSDSPHDTRMLHMRAAPCCAHTCHLEEINPNPTATLWCGLAARSGHATLAAVTVPERRPALAFDRTDPDARRLALDGLPVSGGRAAAAAGSFVVALHRVEGVHHHRVDGCAGGDVSGTIKLTRPVRPVLTLVASDPEKRPRLSLDDRAWREGFRDGEQSQPLRACPYPVGSIERWSWSSGYIEGKAVRQKSRTCRRSLHAAPCPHS